MKLSTIFTILISIIIGVTSAKLELSLLFTVCASGLVGLYGAIMWALGKNSK